MRARTDDVRWRVKPCIDCGAEDWMYGRGYKCESCVRAFAENPVKVAARLAVKDAVRRGVLIRQPCQKCTEHGHTQDKPSHAHHEDYSRPLDVMWLCPLHHCWVHNDRRKEVLPASSITQDKHEQPLQALQNS